MIITRLSFVFAAGLLASTAVAQTAKKPLNLTLSPADVTPAAADSSGSAPTSVSVRSGRDRSTLPTNVDSTDPVAHGDAATSNNARPRSGAATRSSQPSAVSDAPGVYYGDHSADIGDTDTVQDRAPPCDDYTYNQPQVHGSITTGIVSGSHIGTGSYSGGVVRVSKAFGSCDHPGGGISISVGGTTTNGFGRHWGR